MPAYNPLIKGPSFERRPIKVICVGAGFSSIHLAARIRQYAPNVELLVIEKQDQLGGVWNAQRYPGVASDVPSHAYTLSWAPNPEWSRYYANGSEIQDYLLKCADMVHFRDNLRLSTSVDEATWDQQSGLWSVVLVDEKTGAKTTETANILISATGANSVPKMPEIENLEDKSTTTRVVHSGRWPKDLDLKGQRVGIIGNGASALQLIPEIAKEAASLTCFMRSPTWIWSAWFHPIRDAFWGFKEPDSLLTDDINVINPTYTQEHKQKFRKDPAALGKHRHDIENFLMAGSPDLFIKDSGLQQFMIGGFTQLTQFKLQKKPELMDLFLPKWAPLCRRGSPAPGFFEALVADETTVIQSGVKKAAGGTKFIAQDGTGVDLDVLICATGYDTSGAPPFKITGINGASLAGHWKRDPESYLSVSLPDFPNFFTFNGPLFPAWSVIPRTAELFGDYFLQFILKLQRHQYKSFTPKEQAAKDFVKHADAYFVKEHSVFADDCKSWYKADQGQGKVRFVWPGSTSQLLESFAEPLYENYEWVAADPENTLSWLGNGASTYESGSREGKDMAPYFNPEGKEYSTQVPAFRGENSQDAYFRGGIAKARK